MNTMERRKFPFMGRRPDVAEWFEGFPFGLPFAAETHPIRIEESQEGDTYTVRAELPGVDPDKDVEITLDRSGVLTIHAERTEEEKSKEHSEFRYGSFTRSITLPEGVKEEDISASYDKGILTVTAPLGERTTTTRRIEVSKQS
ncbi:small heat shock protein [Streptomyces sp. NBRC 110611]|uniref:Hsp20/alpha crystallin family protein n=1 Tax=Streptomyces sp. NBRC 110611 TaxID=1621259 RepID=UPI00082DFB9A|nr:Hsp20/alpha crystallin family protein [Streptomyces sp. NBRC 110611]GAU69808.1 small heat shock protein [Streptomyces sp. NBRC 110611]